MKDLNLSLTILGSVYTETLISTRLLLVGMRDCIQITQVIRLIILKYPIHLKIGISIFTQNKKSLGVEN